MDIKRDRKVFLGYGKYWRSDAIIGLMPLEEEREAGLVALANAKHQLGVTLQGSGNLHVVTNPMTTERLRGLT